MKTFEQWIEDKRQQTRAINRETGSDIEDTWITIVGQHRDSDILERSNYRVIVRGMRERFPDSVEEHRFGHWAVGWVEECFIDSTNEEACAAAFEWHESLEGYPVADDSDHSDLEFEERCNSWDSWGRREFLRAIEKHFKGIDLSIPDETLDEWEREGEVIEHECDTDGSALWRMHVDRLEWADVLPFADPAELEEAWRAEQSELPPYKRDALPPWRQGASVSLPELS